MFFLEAVTLAIFFGTFATCFLGVLGSGVWLVHRTIQAYMNHLERDLDLRRFEAENRIEQARLQASIPVWVDHTDPLEVAAWNRAVAETWRISARHALSVS